MILLADLQRTRLRALLARVIDRSPFHAARLAGIDPARFELADLTRLPIMTKAQMMEHFNEVVTDPRVRREEVEAHLGASAAEPALLFGDYVCLVSGGSSGLRGVFVQTAEEYAEFAASLMRRAMGAFLAGGGRLADGLVIGIVAAASPVHSSGMAAATAAGPPLRLISAPATWPTAAIVECLNAAQPPAPRPSPVIPGPERPGASCPISHRSPGVPAWSHGSRPEADVAWTVSPMMSWWSAAGAQEPRPPCSWRAPGCRSGSWSDPRAWAMWSPVT